MRTVIGIAALLALQGVLWGACSDDSTGSDAQSTGGDADAPGDTVGASSSADPDSHSASDALPMGEVHADPLPPLSSTCEIPPPPDMTLEERVVGDGTPESCTNEAIQEAASLGGHITFRCGPDPVVIPITATILVKEDAVIDGEGMITLDGLGAVRILWVSNWLQVVLRGLTFTRGSALGAEPIASGGAVRGGWGGTLYIEDCVFTDNVAGEVGKEGGAGISAPVNTNNTVVNCYFENNYAGTGAALHGIGSNWNIINSVFVNNECTADGGGAVYTDGAGDLSEDEDGGLIYLCGCRFSGNIGRTQGGAAYLWAYEFDTVRVSQCVFENNQVLFSDDGRAAGGAIRVGDATFELDRSLFVNNHADKIGGAVWVNGNHPSYITNCTFVGNNAGVEGLSTGGRGGAISGDYLLMTNLTFDGNWAQNMAGAIYSFNENTSLNNSILRNNYSNHSSGAFQVCRTPLAGSNNLEWPEPSRDAPCTENEIFADPLLEELADNGGTTRTEALGENSPAFGRGVDCPDVDQRGAPRTEPCDLGAFESDF